ncbi:MAG: tetratricopeptide repeat protein [Vicinamibacterales bacterium]
MKHSEKEHLKENEVAHALEAATKSFQDNRGQILAIGGGLLALVVAVGGYTTWQRSQTDAVSALLAEAMIINEAPVQPPVPPDQTGSGGATVPTQMPGTYPTEKAKFEAALPKFLAAAEQAPSSTPGRLARLNAAGVLVALGRFDEARAQYDQLTSGGDLIAKSAMLGKAQSQIRQGQFDPAIETLKTLSTDATSGMPVDGVLLELARAYRVAGKVDDARKTFTEIVEKHADSPLATAARTELDRLKS